MPLLLMPGGLLGTFPVGDNAGTSPAPISSPPTVTQWVRCSESALAGAATVKVDVLAAALTVGSRLAFSGGTTATVTAQANAGASSITVAALSAGIAEGETAAGSVNVVMMRRVSPAMPTPILVDGRPT